MGRAPAGTDRVNLFQLRGILCGKGCYLAHFLRSAFTYRWIAARYSARVSSANCIPASCSIMASRRSALYRRFSPLAIPPSLAISRRSSGGSVLRGRRFSRLRSLIFLCFLMTYIYTLNSRLILGCRRRRRAFCSATFAAALVVPIRAAVPSTVQPQK